MVMSRRSSTSENLDLSDGLLSKRLKKEASPYLGAVHTQRYHWVNMRCRVMREGERERERARTSARERRARGGGGGGGTKENELRGQKVVTCLLHRSAALVNVASSSAVYHC